MSLLTVDVQGYIFDDRFQTLHDGGALESRSVVVGTRSKRDGHPLSAVGHQTHAVATGKRRPRAQRELGGHVAPVDGQPQRRRRVATDGDAPDVAQMVLDRPNRVGVGARVTDVVDQQALNSHWTTHTHTHTHVPRLSLSYY